MRKLILAGLAALAPMFAGADNSVTTVPGFDLWSSKQLQEAGERLFKKIGDKEMVFETLGTYKGHSVYLVLRGKTARPEYHETESDIQIGLRGKATFIVGGELIDPEKQPRKQQRGSSIKGGQKVPLGPGDIIHVPVAVPHVAEITPGDPLLYILIKLDEEPRSDALKSQ